MKDCISPLQISCYKNRIDIESVLLQCDDVDIDLVGVKTGSPLYLASQEGHFHVVKELLSDYAKVNNCKDKGISPLWIASQKENLNIVNELLQHSAEVNKQFDKGVSPLWTASHQGHDDVVKTLLKHSSDLNKCCDAGISPVQIEVVNVLLSCVNDDIISLIIVDVPHFIWLVIRDMLLLLRNYYIIPPDPADP